MAEYIETYAPLAVEEMIKHGIPASITLAQGILESGSGNSELAREANNHFGIKCHKEWQGKTYHMDDDDKDECFRKYRSPEESYYDHSQFLLTRDRYAFLFLLEMTDYKAWATGLKKAGYATNPRYADLLIRIIEENGLHRFDVGEGVSTQYSVVSSQLDSVELDYRMGEPFEAELVGNGGNDRNVFENNGVKFIFGREGDTWQGIAEEFGIYGWQVRKYNEMGRRQEIMAGEPVYLERKRSRAAVESHTVAEGETLCNISQRYAVKLKVLQRKNNLEKDAEPEAGSVIRLK